MGGEKSPSMIIASDWRYDLQVPRLTVAEVDDAEEVDGVTVSGDLTLSLPEIQYPTRKQIGPESKFPGVNDSPRSYT